MLMTTNHNQTDTDIKKGSARDAWVKPEIASFEPVAATQAATFNPGDGLSSNS